MNICVAGSTCNIVGSLSKVLVRQHALLYRLHSPNLGIKNFAIPKNSAELDRSLIGSAVSDDSGVYHYRLIIIHSYHNLPLSTFDMQCATP